MQTLLIIIQLFVSIALVVVVLLQRTEGGALDMGRGGSGLGGIFSPRGSADTLTRATAILGVVFFITSIALTLYSLHHGGRGTSILDSPSPAPATTQQAPKAPPTPKTDQAPAVPKPQ